MPCELLKNSGRLHPKTAMRERIAISENIRLLKVKQYYNEPIIHRQMEVELIVGFERTESILIILFDIFLFDFHFIYYISIFFILFQK